MKESHALIDQACRGVRPARTPLFDIFQNDAVIECWSGMRLDGSADAEAMIAAASAALDGTRHVAPPYPEGYAWTDDTGNLHQSARWTSWVKVHAFTTPEQWKAWLPGHIEKLIARRGPSDEEMTVESERQKTLNDSLKGTLFIHCTPSTAINTLLFGCRCGIDLFSYLWADEKDLMLRWMRALRADTLRLIELTAQTGSLAMIYSDVAYHEKLMFSPSMMREMGFFDDVADICELCHRKGVSVIFHSDGYIMEILDDLLAAGVDGLNPLEKAAGMDIYEIRKRHPGLLLVGGVDVTNLLPFGTPEEVSRETRRIIRETGAEGKLLIGSSTEVGNDVPLTNYNAFHSEVMKG